MLEFLAGTGRLVLTLAIAAAGGFAFKSLGMPAPWLTGAAAAVGSAAVLGVGVQAGAWVRLGSMMFLGTVMGATVTPETFGQLPNWPVSLAGLLVVVVAMMLIVSLYLERVHGFDPDTARLACIPGNMAYALALAEDNPRADARQVALVQIVRLAALLICLPSVFDGLGYVAVAPISVAPSAVDFDAVALMFGAGIAAGAVFHWIGFPAGAMCGAMFAGGLLSGSGLLTVWLPEWLLIPGFALIGAVVGANFAGADRRFLAANILPSLGAVLVGTTVALACAVPVAWLIDAGVAQVWLAYAPGGADTMSILALALGLEPTFVVAHHVIRMFGLGGVVPLWIRFYARRGGGDAAGKAV